MIAVYIIGGIIVAAIVVYGLSRIATRGALTEIEEFFKSKKDGNPKD